MRIGQLAAASGVSIRTLRHYDQLGLLSPAERGANGYRLYGEAEVERLYRIRALRALGLSLAEVGSALSSWDEPEELAALVDRQLAEVRSRRAALGSLEDRLVRLQESLAGSSPPRMDQLLTMMEEMTMLEEALRHDYRVQADRYDRSRGVSGDVLAAVAEAIEPAPGRQLVDIGGGTGNYATALRERGWGPVVVDASAAMRARSESKGLPVVIGEATRLPFADGSFDAATMISMLHQVSDWKKALAEARRVLRPGGRLAVMGLTADHLREVAWAYDLFPAMRDFALPHRPDLAEILAELPGATVGPIWFSDLADASIGALCAHPEAMLEPSRRRQTSFFERLERDHPEQLEPGLAILRSWLEEGHRPEREHRRHGGGSATLP